MIEQVITNINQKENLLKTSQLNMINKTSKKTKNYGRNEEITKSLNNPERFLNLRN